MNKDQREILRKLRILRHADETGHVAKTCRYFGIGRSSFYRWREAYRKHGDAGLELCPFGQHDKGTVPLHVSCRCSWDISWYDYSFSRSAS